MARSTDILIDAIEDALDELQTGLDAARKKASLEGEDRSARDCVTTAITQIRRGEYADAITTLEREFMPKWNDKADAEQAYRRAMVSA